MLEVFVFFNQIQSLKDKYQTLSQFLPKPEENTEKGFTSDIVILPPANNSL